MDNSADNSAWLDVEELMFSDLDCQIGNNDGEKQLTEQPHVLSSDDDVYVWETMKLSDMGTLFPEAGDVGLATSMPSAIATAEIQYDAPSPCSSTTNSCTEDVDTTSPCHTTSELMHAYGFTDGKLSDISLRKLQNLCKSDDDYTNLKAYRRTCLNRHYARSSRNKQQNKTMSLAAKLKQAEQTVAQLRQENDTKDATIRCLQLELQILRSLRQESS